MRRTDCPECGGYDTETARTEWFSNMVAETRICNNCPTHFTNKYSLFEQEIDEVVE